MNKTKRAAQNLRTFYTIILTQTLSQIGSRISGLAISIWVYQQTGDATPLGIVAALGVLPMVVMSSVSGVLADRYDRRYVMALADAGQAFGTLLLLASFLSGDFQLWHLYLVTFIQAIFGAFQGPAFSASVTMLVTDDQRDRANTIQQLTGPTAGIVAPALAGLVYAAIGISGAILVDMVTFIVAVAVILMVYIPRPEQTEEGKAMSGSFMKEVFSGVVYLWQKRQLFWLTVHVMFLNFLLAGMGVAFTPYILSRTGSEELLGLFLSLFNVGGLVGGIIFGVWGGTRPRIHTFMIGVIVSAILLAFLGMARNPVAIGALSFVFMMPIPMVNAAAMSMMQVKVAPDMQGRVFAVLGQIAMLLTPISYVLVGVLIDDIFEPMVFQQGWSTVAPVVGGAAGSGIGLLMVFSGAITALLTLFVYAIPYVRNLEANLPDFVAAARQEAADDVPEGAAEDALASNPVIV